MVCAKLGDRVDQRPAAEIAAGKPPRESNVSRLGASVHLFEGERFGEAARQIGRDQCLLGEEGL